jgi:hypothetical protein
VKSNRKAKAKGDAEGGKAPRARTDQSVSGKNRTKGRSVAFRPESSETTSTGTHGKIYCGFHRKGLRMASLEEVRDPAVPTKSLGELSHSELVRLVLARLRRDSHFVPMHIFGVQGVIDRKRAIREVKLLSAVGLHLIEIEKGLILIQLRVR